MTPTRCLALLALGAALALSGCGGSSKSASTTSGKSFDSQLNSLCNRANAAFAAAPNSKAQGDVIARYLTSFRSVKVPAKLQPTYSQYLGVLGQELLAVRQGNMAGLSTLAQNHAKPLAARLGATDCANPK